MFGLEALVYALVAAAYLCPMRIGFDAKRAFFNNTGLGNYSRNLLLALADQYPEEQLLLFTPGSDSGKLFPESRQTPAFQTFTPTTPLGKAFPAIWRSRGMTRSLVSQKVQLFHGLSNELPAGLRKRKIPAVVTLHDLLFIRYPHQYSTVDRIIHRRKFRSACSQADIVVACSEQTKHDIIRCFHIPENRIRVVYQSVGQEFLRLPTAEDKARVKKAYHLPAEFMLYVGSVTERKNLLVVLKAMKQAGTSFSLPLAVVGKGRGYLRQMQQFVKEAGMQNRVFFLEQVPGSDLPGLFAQCQIFIYPSLFEGYGIPVLEAMFAGAPVITTEGTSMQEIGGEAALYCNPQQPDAWEEAMRRLAGDSQLRQTLAEKSKARAQQLTPAKHAAEMMKIYRMLING